MTGSRALGISGHPRKVRFIREYRQTGNIRLACQAAGIRRTTYYYWTEHDDHFSFAVKLAAAEAVEVLEEEARRRAVDGVKREKGVYWQGAQVATETITEYSDSLLMFLLRGLKPEKYKERVQVDSTQIPIKSYSGLDVDQV